MTRALMCDGTNANMAIGSLTTLETNATQFMDKMQKKSVSQPDERRTFDKGQIDVVTLGGLTFGHTVLQPGWKWSTCVKPLVKTNSCQAHHLQYHVSGRFRVVMDDGSKRDFGPGDVALIPPGHDAWVVGNDAVVVIDISGIADYSQIAPRPTGLTHVAD